MQGLEGLLKFESTDNESITPTCFDDAFDESSDTYSESQNSGMATDVDPTMMLDHAFVLDDDSALDFKIGRYWPKRPEYQTRICSHGGRIISISLVLDSNINTCPEEIWRSSSGTRFFRDLYALQVGLLDIIAHQRVIGMIQAMAYNNGHNTCYKLKPSLTKFKFEDVAFSSLSTIKIGIPTPNYSLSKIKINLVPKDVMLLLGLDIFNNQNSWPTTF